MSLKVCYLVVQDPSPFAGQPYTPPAIPQSSHPPLTPLTPVTPVTPVTPLPPLTPGGEPSTPVAKQPTKGLRLSVSCVVCMCCNFVFNGCDGHSHSSVLSASNYRLLKRCSRRAPPSLENRRPSFSGSWLDPEV